MLDTYALRLKSVEKVYRLYGSHRDQIIDLFGLNRIGLKPASKPKEFAALAGIDLEVPRGSRIGIVGRNGAGKTTLLKLICGNFAPTSGTIEVNGNVQALLTSGIGFHPECTGRENIYGAIQYNGTKYSQREKFIEDIIDFCELGDFLDQPFKSYSLGMQARLMFAVATAVHPDILIVDEVLGAGDAYFVAKSKQRVENLIKGGCTMLLVSHSMQQVLELCDEAIWLHEGIVRMRGPSFEVVKSYEEYMQGEIYDSQVQSNLPNPSSTATVSQASPSQIPDSDVGASSSYARDPLVLLQDPPFTPNACQYTAPIIREKPSLRFIAPGGLSRWPGRGLLEICGFDIITSRGSTNELIPLEPVTFLINLVCPVGGSFKCRYAFNISDTSGQSVIALRSQCDTFKLSSGNLRSVTCTLNPLQLGPGEYYVSVAILDFVPLEVLNSSVRQDLLSRSFEFQVTLPSSKAVLNQRFFHSSEWKFCESKNSNSTN